MKVNVSITDRIIRALIALMLLAVITNQFVMETAAIIVGFITFLLFLTSMSGNCPLYTLLGIKTISKN